jgi:hypothetical protein
MFLFSLLLKIILNTRSEVINYKESVSPAHIAQRNDAVRKLPLSSQKTSMPIEMKYRNTDMILLLWDHIVYSNQISATIYLDSRHSVTITNIIYQVTVTTITAVEIARTKHVGHMYSYENNNIFKEKSNKYL